MGGACEDLLTPRVLGPFRDIARQVGGALHDALASAADPGALVDPLLDELAYPLQPTVLVVEDLHWADDATLDLIRLLGRRVEDLHALVVLTYRDDELTPDHPLQRVLGALSGAATQRLPLGRLGLGAVARLVGERGDAPELLRITGGNPFFLTEVIAARDGQVPTTVRDAVHARLQQLEAPTRAALELLAMVPTAVERSFADELLGDEALWVTEAEALGVLGADRDRLWFRHELARRALEQSLPVTRRVHHHRRITDALVRAGADPARILHHASGAADEARIAEHGPAAARQAARAGSHRQAAAHYEQVLRVRAGLPEDVRPALLDEYAYELYHLRRFEDATVQAREAVEAWRRLGAPGPLGDALTTLSRAAYWAGHPAEARDAAAEAIAVVEPLGDRASLACAHLALAHVLMQADDLAAIPAAERAHDLARGLGREDLELQALSYLGTVQMGRGEPAGEEAVREALQRSRARDDHVAVTRVCANLVRDLLRLGRLDEAERYVEVGLRAARKVEFVHGLYMLQGRQAELSALRGRWEEAGERLHELGGAFPGGGVNGSLPLAWLGRLAARRGEETAPALLERAWALAEPTQGIQWIGPVAAARVEVAWLEGDRDAARAAATPALSLADRVDHRWFRGELRRYLARAGEPVQACATCPDAWRLGIEGDRAGAAEAWAAAGSPYERALELAEMQDEAPIREAIGILDQLGAAAPALLARRRLRALGVTRIPRGPQSTTRANPAGLTSRQMEVLLPLAEGLTNAEIADRLVLSVRTVDHHVAAILDKLGVSSRREATRVAGELGIVPAAD